MRHRWRWERVLPLAAIAVLLGSIWPGGAPSAQPGVGEPSSELILLLSGEIRGNLEPCG